VSASNYVSPAPCILCQGGTVDIVGPVMGGFSAGLGFSVLGCWGTWGGLGCYFFSLSFGWVVSGWGLFVYS